MVVSLSWLSTAVADPAREMWQAPGTCRESASQAPGIGPAANHPSIIHHAWSIHPQASGLEAMG